MSLGTTRRHVEDSGVSSSANRFRERALSNRRRPWRRAARRRAGPGGGRLAGLGRRLEHLSGRPSRSPGSAGPRRRPWPPGAGARRHPARPGRHRRGGRPGARAGAVAEVPVRRSWPRTLVVEVVPRSRRRRGAKPSGSTEVVDAEGVTFATGRPSRRACRSSPPPTRGTARRPCCPRSHSSTRCRPTWRARSRASRCAAPTSITLRSATRSVRWGSGADSRAQGWRAHRAAEDAAKVYDVSAPDLPTTR